MKIIGLCGKKGSGKDTFAAYIQKHLPNEAVAFSFAHRLKTVGSLMLPNKYSQLVYGTQEQKNTFIPEYNMTIREFLQKLGTDVAHQFSKTIWTDLLFAQLEQHYQDFKYCIITDVRFPVEADEIKAKGGMIVRIINPHENSTDSHISETALDNYQVNHTIINDKTKGPLHIEELALDFIDIYQLK